MISNLERVSYQMSKIAAYVSAFLLVEMVLHILFEIILRAFFDKSTYVLDEFVAYSVVSITFLSMPYALHDKSLIRMDLVLSKVNQKWKNFFEAFSLIVGIIITSGLLYFFCTKTFWRDFTKNRVSASIAEFPLWIPEILSIAGLTLFLFQLLAMLLCLIKNDKINAIN